MVDFLEECAKCGMKEGEVMLTLVCNHVYSVDMTPDVFLRHRELERSTLVQVSSHVFRNHLPQTFTMFKKDHIKL